MCRCGCGGHCALYPVLLFLTQGFSCAASGIRPRSRYDGSHWPADSSYGRLVHEKPLLSCRFVLAQLKGDWMEFTTTLGFASWNSAHRP
eukprot:894448-Pyramimonas_sp.AAC.1